MFTPSTYSLEEIGHNPMATPAHPQICGHCHQAQERLPNRRSSPRSYAALAESGRRFRIIDWQGMHHTTCRCCGTNEYGERYSVEVQLR